MFAVLSRLFVPFRMHPSGWFVLGFCALLGLKMAGWRFGLPVASVIVASLLLHELGHVLAATLLYVPVREIGLKLGGAYTRRAYATRRRDEILVSAAGPMMNLFLVLPLLFVPRYGAQLALCNCVLGIVNLLPLPSSDGLRIWRTIRNSTRPGEIPAVLGQQGAV